jgi:uncharacterized membrane protein
MFYLLFILPDFLPEYFWVAIHPAVFCIAVKVVGVYSLAMLAVEST